jgi:nucleoid-associated protein YgaU
MAIIVQPGDTLWSLADEHLGSATEWWRLYRAISP